MANSIPNDANDSECTYTIVVNEPQPDTSQYQSKRANIIAKVIGQSSELTIFDQVHLQIKSKKGKVDKRVHENYKRIEAMLQLQVLKK